MTAAVGFRADAPIELLHPPFGRPSGGNVYDFELIAAARRAGVPLHPVAVARDEVERRFGEPHRAFRIWDGLLLERLAGRNALPGGNWGVLLHWLPSHDPSLDDRERRRRETIEDRLVDAASLVVASASPLRCALRARHPGRRIAVCEPGIRDVFLERPRVPEAMHAHGGVELLTVANLVPAKGLDEALSALASLTALPWRWHVIGDRGTDPGYAARFTKDVRRFGLADRVTLHGMRDAADVAQQMDRSDVFVFPSRFESYGMVLAEAAARTLPVLATRVGAAPQLLRDGVDALLVPPGDSAALAQALRRMIGDASLRRRMRDALRRTRRPRSFDRTLAEFLAAVAHARTSGRIRTARDAKGHDVRSRRYDRSAMHAKVSIKRAYDEPSAGDGYRVLVDRVWPRGRRKEELALDEWARDLAPSTALRKWFGHDPERWEAFRERYREELHAPESRDRLRALAGAAGDQPLTLVYSARDERHNQAVVLREMLARMRG